jgi:hypothetical protein
MSERAPSRGGAAGMLLLFSVVVFAIGLGFDFGLNSGRAFWPGAEQGARAVIALIAIVAVAALGRLMRLALGRTVKGDGRGGDQP